jgi:hypothetical protein
MDAQSSSPFGKQSKRSSMANPEHLEILSQGIGMWNKWRLEHSEIVPDLTAAWLTGEDLTGAYFRDARLTGADIDFACLKDTNFVGANLVGASLISSELEFANLSGANLRDTDFTGARFKETIFVGSDLSVAKSLCDVEHYGPSHISIDTLQKSGGSIPVSFLRGCGLNDWEIESAKLYKPNLSSEEINDIQYRIHDLRVSRAFQINPLFISYSHSDSAFVDAIEKHLNQNGVRFWRDIHHAKAGRLETQIDRAIHLNDIVLLILSEHSTNSDWVEYEARKAREKERKSGKDALCPVALDDSWKTCRWPERLKEQIMEYNILDFSNWLDQNQFERMFARLIEGLAIFYK